MYARDASLLIRFNWFQPRLSFLPSATPLVSELVTRHCPSNRMMRSQVVTSDDLYRDMYYDPVEPLTYDLLIDILLDLLSLSVLFATPFLDLILQAIGCPASLETLLLIVIALFLRSRNWLMDLSPAGLRTLWLLIILAQLFHQYRSRRIKCDLRRLEMERLQTLEMKLSNEKEDEPVEQETKQEPSEPATTERIESLEPKLRQSKKEQAKDHSRVVQLRDENATVKEAAAKRERELQQQLHEVTARHHEYVKPSIL